MMFDTLPASNAPRTSRGRAAISAVLIHAFIVGVELRPPGKASNAVPAARDTIRVEIDAPPPVRPTPPPLRELSRRPLPLPPMMPTGPQVPLPPFDLKTTPLSPVDFTATWLRAARSSRDTTEIEPKTGNAPTYSETEVDQLPEMLGTMQPKYPEALRQEGISGSVLLEYVVLPSGKPDSASIRVISSTDTRFTMSVIECLSRVSFKPARRRGLAVPALVQQTIRFENR